MVNLERRWLKRGLLPEVRSQEAISVTNSGESSLEGVLGSSGLTGGVGVSVFDTSHIQKLLDSWGGDDTGTTWGRDESDEDGTTLAGGLVWKGVWLTKRGTPVTSSDRDDGELSNDNGSSDGGSNFLGGLDTETNVTVSVTNNDDSLESGSLTGTGLLLNWLDLHDLVLETWEELVDDLELLNWQGVEVDLLQGSDLAGLHETTELGDWLPALLFLLSATSSATTASWTTTATTGTTTAEAATLLLLFRHIVCRRTFVDVENYYPSAQLPFIVSPSPNPTHPPYFSAQPPSH